MNFAPFENQNADALLANVLQRQSELDNLTDVITELVYQARAHYIGGMCLPFGVLSPGQRREYKDEIRSLIQQPRGGR